MVAPQALLDRAAKAGVAVHLDNGIPTADAPDTPEANSILAELRQHRLEVARWMRRARDPSEAGCPQPENLMRFQALYRLDQEDRRCRGLR